MRRQDRSYVVLRQACEPCGNGDSAPVTVAANLYGAGIHTTVNTIGFAVDAEAQTQLQAIAAAGGGTFYPAETGSILRQRLQEIALAERDLITDERCVAGNADRIHLAFSAE
ncbi:MAG: hypothetical protein ABF254_04570 [Octadecabacter sp.]